MMMRKRATQRMRISTKKGKYISLTPCLLLLLIYPLRTLFLSHIPFSLFHKNIYYRRTSLTSCSDASSSTQLSSASSSVRHSPIPSSQLLVPHTGGSIMSTSSSNKGTMVPTRCVICNTQFFNYDGSTEKICSGECKHSFLLRRMNEVSHQGRCNSKTKQ